MCVYIQEKERSHTKHMLEEKLNSYKKMMKREKKEENKIEWKLFDHNPKYIQYIFVARFFFLNYYNFSIQQNAKIKRQININKPIRFSERTNKKKRDLNTIIYIKLLRREERQSSETDKMQIKKKETNSRDSKIQKSRRQRNKRLEKEKD